MHQPARSHIPDGHVRIGAFHVIPGLIRRLGGNVDVVLDSLPLSEELLANLDDALPMATLGALLARAAKETRSETFGLLVGSQSGLKQLGLPGTLMLLQRSVGAALETLGRTIEFHSRAAVPVLRREDGQAALGYVALGGNFPGFQEWQDGAMAVALNVMRELIGTQWHPDEVRLMRRAPRQPEAYAQFFGAPCRFDCGLSELLFPSATLALPLTASAAKTFEAGIAESIGPAEACELARQDWNGLVRRTAVALLFAGNCSRQSVADALSVSGRTLNRRLQQAGSSYREIVDYSRFAASRMLIRETDMSFAEISRLLNYSAPTAFCRAFRRWAGCSPSNWRQMKCPPPEQNRGIS